MRFGLRPHANYFATLHTAEPLYAILPNGGKKKMNYNKYIEDLHRNFGVSDEDRSLFEKIIETPTERQEDLLSDVHILKERVGLAYALLALYRQQVNSGFVLADPIKPEGKEEKRFFDPDTGITFRLQWNPYRELRHDRQLLIERKVIAEDVDKTKLINPDKKGEPCFLCEYNIKRQNPGEILLEIDLAGGKYYAGANFAYITNNHFTIMSAEHRPQQYRKKILEVLNDFVDKTDGYFRAIFNGLAGASIEEHEHLQVTTEKFPIEEIKIEDKDVVQDSDGIRILQPKYYVPIWIVEGRDRTKIEIAADRIIGAWHRLNERDHTENIISGKSGDIYRTFVILRDKNKLAGDKVGKKGAMAAFETGGNIILSYKPKVKSEGETNERETFDNANLETVERLLEEISPERQLTEVEFTHIGD